MRLALGQCRGKGSGLGLFSKAWCVLASWMSKAMTCSKMQRTPLQECNSCRSYDVEQDAREDFQELDLPRHEVPGKLR